MAPSINLSKFHLERKLKKTLPYHKELQKEIRNLLKEGEIDKTIKELGQEKSLKPEHKIGVNCFAVPVINKEGTTIAVISITSPASRFKLEKIEEIKNELIAISEEISNLQAV